MGLQKISECPACGGDAHVLRMKKFWRCLDSSCGATGNTIRGNLIDMGRRYRGGEWIQEVPRVEILRQLNDATGLSEWGDMLNAPYANMAADEAKLAYLSRDLDDPRLCCQECYEDRVVGARFCGACGAPYVAENSP